jgi:integrase
MPRKRSNPADNWLPPRVYRGRSRYEYRPLRADVVLLCFLPKDKIESPAVKVQVWEDYKKAIAAPVKKRNVVALMEAYFSSPQFAELSANTQKDYRGYSKRIARVFGDADPRVITTPDIRDFMDAMGAAKKFVTANRHLSFLSALLGWGKQRAWCGDNPAIGVTRYKEAPRSRYIEDWEYSLVLGIARTSSYPYLAPMMEVAYMCRARSIEVRAMTESDITDKGVYLFRKKGSISEVTGWSDRLRAAVAEARGLFPKAPTSLQRPLFHSKSGMAIPVESFKTAWGRVMREAVKQGLKERFTFHDIKAKGVSDHDTKASGHRTKKAQAVYDRKPGITAPTR